MLLVAVRSVLVFALFLIPVPPGPAFGQTRQVDVLVTLVKDKLVALPGGGSPVEEPLGVNETIITTGARGPAGFAQTSSRLLGFSSGLHRWTEVQLGGEEYVDQHQILPRLIIVQTNRRVHGFQESRGHWFSEALGPNETVKNLHGDGHILVAITTERALAISALTGGFFTIRWSANEHLQSIDHTRDAVLIRTSTRHLSFRSQIGGWMEMR
jgi:hypothetical protein